MKQIKKIKMKENKNRNKNTRQNMSNDYIDKMSKNIIDDLGIKVEYDTLNKKSVKKDKTLLAMENMESILINELNKCFGERERIAKEMGDELYEHRLKDIMTKEQFQEMIKRNNKLDTKQ